MNGLSRLATVAALVLLTLGPSAWAGAGLVRHAAREAVTTALRRLGTTTTRAATGPLSRRAAALAARHGDAVLAALRRSGPTVLTRIEAAGPHARLAARLLDCHGDDTLRLVAHPRRLALVAEFGDDAARALIRHGAVAEPAIASFGLPAARALAAVGPRQARRLAMLAESGTLTRTGGADALLAVVGRHGDRALQFVWRHKGALAVSAVLARFLADPEPYLDGTRELGSTAVQTVVRPVAAVSDRVAGGIGRLATAVLTVAVTVMAVSPGLRVSRRPSASERTLADPASV